MKGWLPLSIDYTALQVRRQYERYEKYGIFNEQMVRKGVINAFEVLVKALHKVNCTVLDHLAT